MKTRGIQEEIKLFAALQNCLGKPKCQDCPWEDCNDPDHETVEVPRSLLLEALYMLREKNCRVWELLYKIEGLQEDLKEIGKGESDEAEQGEKSCAGQRQPGGDPGEHGN